MVRSGISQNPLSSPAAAGGLMCEEYKIDARNGEISSSTFPSISWNFLTPKIRGVRVSASWQLLGNFVDICIRISIILVQILSKNTDINDFGAKLHGLWAERDFFWLNWSPWCFYRIPSGFLLRSDKIKSGCVTVLVFRFSDFFSRKMMIFEFFSPQNLKYHQISLSGRLHWCK